MLLNKYFSIPVTYKIADFIEIKYLFKQNLVQTVGTNSEQMTKVRNKTKIEFYKDTSYIEWINIFYSPILNIKVTFSNGVNNINLPMYDDVKRSK